MELPPYRLPNVRTIFQNMLTRAWLFVKRAGTVILAISIVLWALMYFPHSDQKAEVSSQQSAVSSQRSAESDQQRPAGVFRRTTSHERRTFFLRANSFSTALRESLAM